MAVRTVRLEQDMERALKEIQRVTGLSASAAIRRGLVALREQLRQDTGLAPYEVYAGLELGPGGHARAPARQAKRALKALLRKKRSA